MGRPVMSFKIYGLGCVIHSERTKATRTTSAFVNASLRDDIHGNCDNSRTSDGNNSFWVDLVHADRSVPVGATIRWWEMGGCD